MGVKIYQVNEKQYYIPCREKHLKWLDEWAKTPESEGKIVLFGSPDDEQKETLIMICHGTPEGYIKLQDKIYYPESILRGFIQNGIINSSIKHILTLSCYGGNQVPATINGITIESLHTSVEKILVQGYSEMPTSTGHAISFILDCTDDVK